MLDDIIRLMAFMFNDPNNTTGLITPLNNNTNALDDINDLQQLRFTLLMINNTY